MSSKRKSLGLSIAGGISALLINFLTALCHIFKVTPDGLKRPGTRPNVPPASGGISSLD